MEPAKFDMEVEYRIDGKVEVAKIKTFLSLTFKSTYPLLPRW